MKERRILYETSLAKTAMTAARAMAFLMLFLLGIGLFFAFGMGYCSSPSVLVGAGLLALAFGWQIRKMLPLLRNPGVYQIAIDNYGLYVHSDAPDFAPSFSIVATDLSRLVRKTIIDSEGSEQHEYYVETKSGRRHRIQNLLMFRPHLKVMDLFDRITDCFPTLEIVEEE